MAGLTQRSHPTPEDPGSNLVMGNLTDQTLDKTEGC